MRQDRPDAARNVRRSWLPLIDGERHVVWAELGSVIGEPSPASGRYPSMEEKQMRYAEIRALIGDAEAGRLVGDDWDHVSRNPLLWELRLRFGGGGDLILVRSYFHEPDHRPRQTVVAKIHVKDHSSRDSDEIKRLQNAQIDEAGERIDRCRPDEWGIERCSRTFTDT